jgi:glycerol-3-phosphate cytidylyltransferase-like family protein
MNTLEELKGALKYCNEVIAMDNDDISFELLDDVIILHLRSGHNIELSQEEVSYRAELQENKF